MRRALLATALIALLAPAAAAAKPLRVGVARLAGSSGGGAALLIPVRYPIALDKRPATLRLVLRGPDGSRVLRRRLTARPSAGALAQPERRRGFRFVHRVDLGRRATAALARGTRVEVAVRGRLDANGDGRPELRMGDRREGALRAAPRRLCSDLPRLRARPGRATAARLPACGGRVRWRIAEQPGHGAARARRGRIAYRPARRFRGTDTVELLGLLGPGRKPLRARATVTVGASGEASIRAFGDSVTAGFGYYSNGSEMGFGSLIECRPGVKPYNDACSSNSATVKAEGEKLAFAPDYGLSNNVSWAAQWANAHGVANFENLAISGSEPSDWVPGGDLHPILARMEAEDPDYVVLTVGANPLLSDMLFGIDNMGCAIYADVLGGYRECVERAFAEAHLARELRALYANLVAKTDSTIYLMQYHLSVPSSALAYSSTQIAEMGQLLNAEIAAAAHAVDPSRLHPVAPPHFNVGVDISPVYPSRYSCSRFGYAVDGPSVQSDPTQDELEIAHPLSFCEGPKPEGPPWVIGADTGIHPSATGYSQMASRLPAPSAG